MFFLLVSRGTPLFLLTPALRSGPQSFYSFSWHCVSCSSRSCLPSSCFCYRFLHVQSPKLIMPLSLVYGDLSVGWLVLPNFQKKKKNLSFYVNIFYIFFIRFLDFGFCLEKTVPMIQLTFYFLGHLEFTSI